MTVYVVDLESIETRYTCEWKTHVPELLRKANLDVEVISGPDDIPSDTTPGAFLNFGGTNVYKAVQVEKFSRLIASNKIKDGDYFLFTDAWHPGVINLKYMLGLLNIKAKIGGLWHSGGYDKNDFLGRALGHEDWVKHAEKSFFHAYDHNYFATDYHISMFVEDRLGEDTRTARMRYMPSNKIVRTGWPMEYLPQTLSAYKDLAKKDLILFPHRIAPEKQVDIFLDLKKELPEYEFVVCQDKKLTKKEYHTLLGQSKRVFSASNQETLGISWFESAVVGSMPLVPDRLSYYEMGLNRFKYPSEWTTDWDSYQEYKSLLIEKIRYMMQNYETILPDVQRQQALLEKKFFSADDLVKTVSQKW